jgi:phenylalanine-4-hydroxylase
VTTASPLHGLAAGNAGGPGNADWTVPQHWSAYTPAEHAVWRTLFERQTALLPGRACDAFVHGMRDLPMAADHIPHFAELNEVLKPRTGWEVVAVPGLVPETCFSTTWRTGVFRRVGLSARRTSWTTCKSPTCSTTCSVMCPCS